jgi:protein-S-isoprenylcysteine O-methyltransferase Ste14
MVIGKLIKECIKIKSRHVYVAFIVITTQLLKFIPAFDFIHPLLINYIVSSCLFIIDNWFHAICYDKKREHPESYRDALKNSNSAAIAAAGVYSVIRFCLKLFGVDLRNVGH